MPRTSSTSTTSRNKSTSAHASARTDALSILAEDHKRVQKMFKQFEKLDRDDADALRELAEQACEALEMHTTLEEEIFYPAVREALDDDEQEMMAEAQVEHDSAKQLIEQLRQLQPDDERYAATFTVLGEYVNHHIDEEEGEIFKQAKKSDLDLDALGEAMEERRTQLQEMLDGGGSDAENEASGGDERESGGAPREIPVKEMDIEDEADMEPARGNGARGRR